MKNLFTYLALFILLISASFLGARFFLSQASAADEGKNVEWVILESPPEKARAVIAPNYIETISGKYFYYDSFHCENNCWKTIDNIETPPESTLPLSKCGWYPNTNEYIDSIAICEEWGQGFYKRVWAIDKQGNVWLWEKGKGEGGLIMVFISPIVGFFTIFLLGGLILTLFIILRSTAAYSSTSKRN